MSERKPPAVVVRPPRKDEWPKAAPDEDLLATDPDGVFVAVAPDGRVVWRAAAAVREDALLLARLDAEPSRLSDAVSHALLEAIRAYGASRRTRLFEAVAPGEPASVAFLLRAGLSLRTLVLTFAGATARDVREDATLANVGLGAALSGWVADLDREARGFARTPDWERAVASGTVFALRRGGRPTAVGALWRKGETAALGPVLGRSPEASAALLLALAARAGAPRLSVRLPAEAGALLAAVRRLGLAATKCVPLLTDRKRGDFRSLAGAPGLLF